MSQFEYDVTSIKMLEDNIKESPRTCQSCSFFMHPAGKGFMDMYPGLCRINVEFNRNANWILCASDDNGCNSITFLKKLIEVT